MSFIADFKAKLVGDSLFAKLFPFIVTFLAGAVLTKLVWR